MRFPDSCGYRSSRVACRHKGLKTAGDVTVQVERGRTCNVNLEMEQRFGPYTERAAIARYMIPASGGKGDRAIWACRSLTTDTPVTATRHART
jgi:hypothetical protein